MSVKGSRADVENVADSHEGRPVVVPHLHARILCQKDETKIRRRRQLEKIVRRLVQHGRMQPYFARRIAGYSWKNRCLKPEQRKANLYLKFSGGRAANQDLLLFCQRVECA